MQRLEVSGAVRPIYGSLGVKRLRVNSLIVYELPRRSTQLSAPFAVRRSPTELSNRRTKLFLSSSEPPLFDSPIMYLLVGSWTEALFFGPRGHKCCCHHRRVWTVINFDALDGLPSERLVSRL